jgi:hypothetical protein
MQTNENQTWAQVLAANAGSNAVMMDTSNTNGAKVAQIAAAHSTYGVGVSSSSYYNKVSGEIYVGSNTTKDCNVLSATQPGLVDTNCTTSGTDGSTDFPAASTGGTLRIGLDLTSSFVGKVTADDSFNGSDTNGAIGYDSIADWVNFSNRFRGWGRDSTSLLDAGVREGCLSGIACRIWDLRLSSSDTQVRNRNGGFTAGASCPVSATGNKVLTDYNSNTFLINALEAMEDGIGDDDGLCESYESCVYSPNIGAYQGDGDPFAQSACTFTGGTVTGIQLFGFPTNGG